MATRKPVDQKVEIQFVMLEKVSVHPEKGVPQMYYDQLNIIAQHHLDLKENSTTILQYKTKDESEDDDWKARINQLSDETAGENIAKQKNAKVVEKLTRRLLVQRDDWDDWKKSEVK